MDEEVLVKKWLAETLSESERLSFEQTETYRKLQRTEGLLQRMKAPDYDVEAEEKRLPIAPRQVGVVSLWQRNFLKVAASLLLVLSAALVIGYLLLRDETVRVLAATKTTTYLPDSSEVALNKASSLTYSKSGWNKARVVELSGEGFFKVSHGSRFDVKTSLGTVTVVGTQFNVKSRTGYFEVQCYEGTVKVRSKGTEQILKKGQGWRLIGGLSAALELGAGDGPGWLGNESRFESVPYGQVVEEFERQYGVKVKLVRVDANQMFTGSFTHDNINLALKSITLPLNIKFDREENLVRLSGDQ